MTKIEVRACLEEKGRKAAYMLVTNVVWAERRKPKGEEERAKPNQRRARQRRRY